jgi:hypothetical protein
MPLIVWFGAKARSGNVEIVKAPGYSTLNLEREYLTNGIKTRTLMTILAQEGGTERTMRAFYILR